MNQNSLDWPEANRTAAREIGGHAAVAELLGFKDRRNVWAWTTGERKFPAEHCAKLEAAAKTVTRRELRPDDWQDIWPELIDATAGQGTPVPAEHALAQSKAD